MSTWISVKDKLPPTSTIVLAWAEWYGCRGMTWIESKKEKTAGHIFAYLEKNIVSNEYDWWDKKATINSSPMNVLYWQELPSPPIENK